MLYQQEITGVILAGGESSRMKTNKALLTLHGKSFIERIVNAMSPLVSKILIVGNQPNFNHSFCRKIHDDIPNMGPLGGLYTALQESRTDYLLVLSCDVPLVTTALLGKLTEGNINGADVVQFQTETDTMPLVALYKKSCLDVCKELIDRGELRLRKLAEQVQSKSIRVTANLALQLQNINTTEEYQAL